MHVKTRYYWTYHIFNIIFHINFKLYTLKNSLLISLLLFSKRFNDEFTWRFLNIHLNQRKFLFQDTFGSWTISTLSSSPYLITHWSFKNHTHKSAFWWTGSYVSSVTQCHFSILTIRRTLNDCLTLRHLYRQYFKTTVPIVPIIGQTPHLSLFWVS